MAEPTTQIQSWLRTMLLLGTIVAAIIGAVARMENRLTILEVTLSEVGARTARIEQSIAHSTR